MNLFAVSSLLCGVFGLVLAVFSAIRGNSKSYRLLTVFNIEVAFWGFGCFLMGLSTSAEFTLLSYKIANLGGFFLATIFYHLVTVLFKLDRKKILICGYAQGLLFTILNFSTDWVLKPVRVVFDLHYIAATPLYTLATFFHLLLTILSFVELFRFLNAPDEQLKICARYVGAGFFIGFFLGTSILLPIFYIDWFYPAGNLGVFIYAAIITYAVLYRRILDFEKIAQIVRREKLIAIGTLTTSINHEIRNPLYIIQGLSQTHLANLNDGVYPDSEAALQKSKEVIEKSAEQATRAMEIMKCFAMFAKREVCETANKGFVDLNQTLENIFPLVNHELQLDKIKFHRDFPSNLPPVQADSHHLEEIFFNLIVNACQAMKGTGGEIFIGAEQYNGTVRIKVEDSGPGIPADRLTQVFEPFYTTKQEGTGLGLYVTKQLVEKNGGKISVKSQMGKGTSFTLEFKR